MEKKLSDGDISGAVRVLCSDATLAPVNAATLEALNERHPSPPHDLQMPPPPDNSPEPISVSTTTNLWLSIPKLVQENYPEEAAPPSGLRRAIRLAPKKIGQTWDGTSPLRITFAMVVKAWRRREPAAPVWRDMSSLLCCGLSLSGPEAEPGLKARMLSSIAEPGLKARMLSSIIEESIRAFKPGSAWFSLSNFHISTSSSGKLTVHHLHCFLVATLSTQPLECNKGTL